MYNKVYGIFFVLSIFILGVIKNELFKNHYGTMLALRGLVGHNHKIA